MILTSSNESKILALIEYFVKAVGHANSIADFQHPLISEIFDVF